jgi:hypothetical protein
MDEGCLLQHPPFEWRGVWIEGDEISSRPFNQLIAGDTNGGEFGVAIEKAKLYRR